MLAPKHTHFTFHTKVRTVWLSFLATCYNFKLTLAGCQRSQAVQKFYLRPTCGPLLLHSVKNIQNDICQKKKNNNNRWKIPIQLASVGLAPIINSIWPTIISQNLRPPISCGWSPFAHAYYFYFELAVWGLIQESKYTVIYSPCHSWNSNLTSDPSDLCEIIKFMRYWKFQTGRHTNHKLLIGTWVTHHHQTFLDQS